MFMTFRSFNACFCGSNVEMNYFSTVIGAPIQQRPLLILLCWHSENYGCNLKTDAM